MEMDNGRLARPDLLGGARFAGRCKPAQYAVVRERGVGDIGAAEARHVTGSAVVLLLLPPRCGQTAAGLLMTAQAARAVVGRFFLRLGQKVRIVAGNAAQLAAARLVTAAVEHLAHVADRLGFIMEPGPGNINRPEQVERQARAKIKRLPVAARDARLAVEMALLADRFAQGRLQMPWIDDRVVSPLDGCCGLAAGDVQCAGTMTALAANRAALK